MIKYCTTLLKKLILTSYFLSLRSTWVQGVPGCGKTTFESDDLVLFPTRKGATDFRSRLKEKHPEKFVRLKDSCRTIHSFIIHSTQHLKAGGTYRRLIVDEALMPHAGEIFFAAALAKVDILNAGLSDHTAQLCKINTSAPEAQNRTFYSRKFNQRNVWNLKSILTHEIWKSVFNEHEPEDAYRNFSKIIAGAINQSCPMVKSRKKTRKQSSIANYEAEVLKQEFLQAQNKYLLSGTAEDKITMLNKKKDYDLKLKTLRRQATAVQIQ
ncbi:hypothetical protein J6590_088593 [Homalodisca vitripennis]|nr:hypothetical protein J6590_088593 [Homalodisca vitripennis]